MASLRRRLLKPGQAWRIFNSLRILTSASSPAATGGGGGGGGKGREGGLQHRLNHWINERQMCTITSSGKHVKPVSKFPESFSMLPAVLAGAFGIGMLQFSHADAKEQADPQAAPISESPPLGYDNGDEIVRHEKDRIEGLLRMRSKGMPNGSYPPFTIAIKDQKVTIKFDFPSTGKILHLIYCFVRHVQLMVKEHGGSSAMILRVENRVASWKLTLNHPKKNEVQGERKLSEEMDGHEGQLGIVINHPLSSSDHAEIEFIKQGSFSWKDLDVLVFALEFAGTKEGSKRPLDRKPRGYPESRDNKTDSAPFPVEKSVAYLEGMGVKVFGLGEPHAISSNAEISWENIAGYNPQKREIEDSILLALHSPEVYDDIARVARHKFVSNRPRAVLFEGPPGTGKTSCARAIANQAVVPLIYVPLEVVMSMYYGESVRLLEKVFSLANELPDGAIIFLDEVDSFAIARDDRMHEATHRILSVLLRQIDGFEQEKRVVVIAATNRTKDLDPALISRFDLRITFGLPDRQNREDIAAHYAKHLKKPDLVRFSCVTEGLSGRDIRDVCQQAERHWASKIIRGEAPSDAEQRYFPPIQEYLESASNRRKAIFCSSIMKKRITQDPKFRLNKDPFVSV